MRIARKHWTHARTDTDTATHTGWEGARSLDLLYDSFIGGGRHIKGILSTPPLLLLPPACRVYQSTPSWKLLDRSIQDALLKAGRDKSRSLSPFVSMSLSSSRMSLLLCPYRVTAFGLFLFLALSLIHYRVLPRCTCCLFIIFLSRIFL